MKKSLISFILFSTLNCSAGEYSGKPTDHDIQVRMADVRHMLDHSDPKFCNTQFLLGYHQALFYAIHGDYIDAKKDDNRRRDK